MTRRATHSDGEEAMAVLARGRRAKTAEQPPPPSQLMSLEGMRRCIGSTRFGIEAHEAPTTDFPIQPSRKDGLGLMCKPHWSAYVKGLRQARGAGKGAAPKAPKASATKATTKRERRRSPMAHIPPAKASEIAKAEALIAEIDALPAPEMVRRVGDDDVPAALEAAAAGRISETPLGETIEGDAAEADVLAERMMAG